MNPLNYDKILENLLVPLKESQIVAELKKISQNFTSKREKIGEYVESKEMVSAYSCFYLPTNMVKFKFLMDQLPESLRERIGELDFLDIGTGPGTYLLAHQNYFETDNKLFGVDSSSLMIDQAKKFLGDRAQFSFGLPPDFSKGTLFFGNSLNEMKLDKAIDMVSKTSPEIILLIEPGTKHSFALISEFRKSMIEKGYGVVFPCPAPKKNCPVSGEEWCHQVLRTVHEPEVERLSQLISLDRKIMPMIAHCYLKNHEGKNHRALFYRFLKETKHSFDWQVCLEKNEKLVTFEIPKRGMSKKEMKEFSSKNVGEAFDYVVEKELGPDKFRITLK
ncbi:MAG: hypothetical protein EP319_08990 [Deltaproteobacteria bacterium]|nr:MAG: hypothetical protein EP319_08990 [Deltaproteobacteria bacterium]